MKRLSLVLILALLLTSAASIVWADDTDPPADICDSGQVAFPNQMIYLGDARNGYPVFVTMRPTSSRTQGGFATLYGFLESPADSGQFVQIQPAGSTLAGGPKILSWSGVSVTVQPCGFFIYRYQLNNDE